MVAEGGGKRLGELAVGEGEGGAVEFSHHHAATEPSEVTAIACRAGILRIFFFSQFGEISSCDDGIVN